MFIRDEVFVIVRKFSVEASKKEMVWMSKMFDKVEEDAVCRYKEDMLRVAKKNNEAIAEMYDDRDYCRRSKMSDEEKESINVRIEEMLGAGWKEKVMRGSDDNE